jgi:hypothetical protein
MSTNRFLWVQVRRELLVGAAFCALLVLPGEPVQAHGDDISETNPSSPEAAGRQAACWALTIPYGAAKMVYSIGGGIVGGFAWAATGGNMAVAKSVWIPSMTGDYIVQPQHLAGEKHLYFVGVSSESRQP